MSSKRTQSTRPEAERFKLEPLAERILFSADIPWFSDILNVDATNSTNAEKTYYTEGLQTVLVSSNSSTGNDLGSKNIDKLGFKDSVTEHGADLVVFPLESSDQPEDTLKKDWVSSTTSKIKSASPLSKLSLPVDEKGQIKVSESTSLSTLDLLVYADDIASWGDSFDTSAKVVTYSDISEDNRSISVVSKFDEQSGPATERTLETLLGVAVTQAESANSTDYFAETNAQTRAYDTTVYVVTTLADDGAGSLRDAITQANAANEATPVLIHFNVSGTISLQSALPTITTGVQIDAFNGVATNGTPKLTIDGSDVNVSSTGLSFFQANDSLVRGMIIANFTETGIYVSNTTGFSVQSSYVGTDGTNVMSTGEYGIHIDKSSLTSIGDVGTGNVIAGTTSAAIYVSGSNVGFFDDVTIVGNFIGVSADGNSVLGNNGVGIQLLNVTNALIGKGEAERNYIGGNNGTAISINHSNNVTVGGNVIGLLADGSTIAKNIGDGVLVAGSSNNVTIGWSSEYSTTGNIISGNTGNGIHIIDAADTIKISGNEIGLKDNGTTSAGNLQDGINISGNVTNVIIGDQSAAAVNVISANGGSGVYLSGDNLFNINLENNLIGLDSSGSTTLGNAQYGIWVDLPVGIDAGISIGTPGGFGNIISGNLLGQINITGGSSSEIVGNFIGTDGSRSEVLSGGSDSFGIRVTGSSSLNAIGTFSRGNTIVGYANNVVILGSQANSNTVVNNDIGHISGTVPLVNTNGTGIYIADGSSNNSIRHNNIYFHNTAIKIGASDADLSINNALYDNRFYGNTGLLVDLGSIGANVNDSFDVDQGPNNLLNSPVITSAIWQSADSVLVNATVNAEQNESYVLSFYAKGTSVSQPTELVDEAIVITGADGMGVVNTTLTSDRLNSGELMAVLTLFNSNGGDYSSEFSETVNIGQGGSAVTILGDSDEIANTVNENNLSGASVGLTINAKDDDVNDTVTYSLSEDSNGQFVIGANSGIVTANAGLDAEEALEHTVTVVASSSDGSTDSQSFTISVADISEFYVEPVVDGDSGANVVDESAIVGSSTGVIALSEDADIGDSVRYSLVNSSELFTIDNLTGVLTTNQSLQGLAGSTEVVTLLASSTDGSISVTTISISISGEIRAIEDSDTSPNIVLENSPANTSVGIIANALEPDANDTVTYALSDDANGLFTINANNGLVTTTEPLDAEAVATQSISVVATSSDGSTSVASYTIAIEDVNESAPVIAEAEVFIAESISDNEVILTLNSTDSDVNSSTQQWTIVDGNEAGAFAIDPGTGELSVIDTTLLDAEIKTVYELVVTVSDGQYTSTPGIVVVTVTDVNDNAVSVPADNNASDNTILNTSAVGTPVGITVNANDADSLDSVTLSLSDNAGGRFSLDQNTLEVLTAAPMVTEAGNSFTITVLAVSTDGSTSESIFTISVLAENSFIPQVEELSFDIPENAADNTVVGTLSATDQDIVSEMSDWQIVSGNDAGVFALDAVTGELSVVNASLLDAELEEISTLVVSVSDGNNVSLPATITINVTDVSEFAPQITAIPIKVVENSPSNLAIATLTATDLDVNSIAEQWTIVSGNESNFLSLDPDTGVVSTQLPVDANETPSFEIVVTVSDGTFTSAPTVVPVEVLGLGGSNNIEVTDIDPDANQVSELAAIGTPVNVQLNDTNLNSAAFTTLTLVDDADGRFILNPETGQIVTAKPIVGDAGNTYTVTVQAQSIVEGVVEPSIDQYLFSITVTGEIRNLTDSSTDINEILETQSVGSVVGITAVAEDPDSIDTITYSLAGSASDIFNIDAVSGVVTTAVALDAELENSHDLEVTATSSDGSSISSLFAIAVIDVNEAAPVAFSQAIAVYENDNNQLLIPMIASDGDVDSNLSQWRIDGGSGSPYFDIDTDTGVISLRNDVTLDFETTSTYELAVSVSDGEIRSAPTSVVVHVVDINEEPQLVTAEYETVTNFVGDIGQLEVIDPDTGDTHTFQIQGTNETGLELSESGSLQQINELQPGFIDVPVLVTDLSGASGSGIIRVSVIEAVAEPDNGAAVEEPSTEPSIPGTGGTDPSNTGGELTDPAVPNGETVEPTVPENAGPDSPTDGGDTQAPEGTPSEPEIADELSVNGLAAANPIHNETISTNIMASVLDLAKGDSLTPVTVSAGLTTNANGQATANSVNGDSGFNSVNSNDQLAEQPLFSTSVSNSNPNSLEDTEFFALQDDAGRYTQDLSQLLNERNRLDAIKLQLARLNGDDGKALILDIGNGKRLVLELLLNAEGEGDNEEVWLGSMFINSHIGASFSPKLIDALYALSSDMEDDAELRDSDHKFKVNAVTFVSAGLTLGFVTWLLHSGSLVASAITSAPLWQRFDPIPVLAKRVVNPDDPQ